MPSDYHWNVRGVTQRSCKWRTSRGKKNKLYKTKYIYYRMSMQPQCRCYIEMQKHVIELNNLFKL